MTVSPARRWRAAATAALAAGLIGGGAAAQTAPAEAPILLVPPPQDELATPTAPPAAGEGAATIDLGRAPAGIEVDTLAAAATGYAGVLEPATGGFGAGMWAGTDRALVERLLPRLPSATGSAATRSLARRLLLSSAEAPAGSGAGRDLMQLRTQRLAALGDQEDLAALLALMPERQDDAATARLRLEALWLAGDADAACAEVETRIRQFDQDVYWQRALIFCQARAGQADRAALGLALLNEQGNDDDRAFVAAVEAISAGKPAPAETIVPASGLQLAMARALGQSLSVAPTADPAVLAAMAETPGADPAMRLAAAEQAVAVGALAPDALMVLYAQEPTQPGELDAALSLAESDAGPHGRAVLYQAALRARQPAARAAVLQQALEQARRRGDLASAARVHLPLLVEVTPAPELAWFAAAAGRALYLVGRYELAGEWLAAVQVQAATDPEAAAAAAPLSLLAEIAGAPPAGEAGSAVAWLAARIAAGDEDAPRQADRLIAVLAPFGAPLGGVWRLIGEAPAEPSQAEAPPEAALLFALDDAAAGGRVGETVLLALANLGAGPGSAHPLALADVIRNLRRIGLDAEARALAVEAAIAGGV